MLLNIFLKKKSKADEKRKRNPTSLSVSCCKLVKKLRPITNDLTKSGKQGSEFNLYKMVFCFYI